MVFRHPFLLLLITASCASFGDGDTDRSSANAIVAPPPRTPAPAPTFANPVIASDCPDPGVLDDREHDRFVMVCTGGRFRIRTSPDLVTWTDTDRFIFPDGKPPWAIDGKRDWAPEIHRVAPGRWVA